MFAHGNQLALHKKRSPKLRGLRRCLSVKLSKEFYGLQGLTAYFKSGNPGRALVPSEKLIVELTGHKVY